MPGLDVGHIRATLDAVFDEGGFRRFDAAIEGAKGKAARGVKVKVGADVSETEFRGADARIGQLRREADRPIRASVSVDVDQSSFARAKAEMRDLESSGSSLSGVMGAIQFGAMGAAALAAAPGLNVLAGSAVGLAGGLAPLGGLIAALPQGLSAMAQGLGVAKLATDGISQAVSAYETAQNKAGTASASTARQQSASAYQVQTAEHSLTQAQQSAEVAQQALTLARFQATRQLQDMKRAQIDSALGERGARLNVQQSIIALRQAEVNPQTTFLQLQQLQLGVDQAKASLRDSQITAQRAHQDYSKAQQEGVNQMPAVVAARRAVSQANDQVTQSTRALAEAQKQAATAISASTTNMNAYRAALAGLSPAQQTFVKFLISMQERWDSLNQAAASGFLPGLRQGIVSAMGNFGRLKGIVKSTGDTLGGIAKDVGRYLGSRGVGRDIERYAHTNIGLFHDLEHAGLHFANGFRNIMDAAQPFLRWLGRLGVELSKQFDQWTNQQRRSGGLRQFFHESEIAVHQVIHVVKDLGQIISNVLGAAQPLGKALLGGLGTSLDSITKWTGSQQGQKSMRNYFLSLKQPIEDTVSLLAGIGSALFRLSNHPRFVDALIRGLNQLLPLLTPLLEVLVEMAMQILPSLIPLLKATVTVIDEIGFAAQDISNGGIASLLQLLTWMIQTVPGVRELAGAFVVLWGAFKFKDWLTGLDVFKNLGKAITGVKTAAALLSGEQAGVGFGQELLAGIGNAFRTRKLSEVFAPLRTRMLRTQVLVGMGLSWASDMISGMTSGISTQIGKVRAAARRVAIAFIGIVAPEIAAGMAAGGKLGELLAARFPKITEMFRTAGKWSGRAFVAGVLVGAVLIGYELGQLIGKQIGVNARDAFINWGIKAGQWFVNALITVINQGIQDINDVLNASNVAAFAGVSAPQIGKIGKVNFNTVGGVTPPHADVGPRGTRGHPSGGSVGLPGGGRAGTSIGPGGGGGGAPAPRITTAQALKELNAIDQGHATITKRMADRNRNRTGAMADQWQTSTKASDNSVQKNLGDARDAHDKATTLMRDRTVNRFGAIADSVKNQTDNAAKTLGDNVVSMQDSVTNGMGIIQDATNKALKAFGVAPVDLGVKAGKGAKAGAKGFVKGATPGKAMGGPVTVPGTGLHDTVPLFGDQIAAMVAPGESLFAANRYQQPMLDFAVANTFGVPGLDAFFATFNRPHYAARGGEVPSYAQGGNLVFPFPKGMGFGRIDQGVDFSGAGTPFGVMGDARVLSRGNLFSGFGPPSGGIVYELLGGAPGGFGPTSKYVYSFEDIAPIPPVGAMLHAGDIIGHIIGGPNGMEMGFATGASGSPLTPYGGAGDGTPMPAGKAMNALLHALAKGKAISGGGGAVPRILEPIITGPPNALHGIAQAALRHITAGANRFVDKHAGAGLQGGVGSTSGPLTTKPFPGGALSPGQFIQYARKALALTGHKGIPGGAQKLESLSMKESSLNPNAWNKTDINAQRGDPSQGLMQVTQSNFRAFHERGTSMDIFDPLANIAASINYQFGTYGGLVTHSPYARGGRIGRFAGGGKMVAASAKDAPIWKALGIPNPLPISNEKRVYRILQRLSARTGYPLSDPLMHPGGAAAKAALKKRIDAQNAKALLAFENKSSLKGHALKVAEKKLKFAQMHAEAKQLATIPSDARWRRMALAYIHSVVGSERSQGADAASAIEGLGGLQGFGGQVSPISNADLAATLSFHPPESSNIAAFEMGMGVLPGIDSLMANLQHELGATYSDKYLAPFRQQTTALTAAQKAALAKATAQSKAAEKKALHAIRKEKGKKGLRDRQAIARRAQAALASRQKAIKGRFGEQLAHVMDPVDAARTAIQTQFADASARGAAIEPLTFDAAAEIRRTLLIGRLQAPLTAPSFARGGRLPSGYASGGAVAGGRAAVSVSPQIQVVIADPTLAALDPHIEAVVDGKQRQLGRDVGARQQAVSSPNRRVVYR